MKQIYLSTIFLMSICNVFGQLPEFPIYENGLIYSKQTMEKLTYVVDSLNLKYQSCELYKKYYVKSQAKAHIVYLEGEEARSVYNDLKKGVALNALLANHPQLTLIKEVDIMKTLYDDGVSFHCPSLDEDNHRFSIFKKNISRKKRLVFNFNKKSDYAPASITALFFINDFHQKELPEEYAKMILYSDCLIDTSTNVYIDKIIVPDSIRVFKRDTIDAISEFLNYFHKKTKRPKKPYTKKYYKWLDRYPQIIETELLDDEKFMTLLEAAANEAWAYRRTDELLEDIIGKYYSPDIALNFKRRSQPVGMCSQDPTPRIHAKKIAILAADATNWEVFLRAHLDIMNDNFSRATDGSYAWKKRDTYLKEIEELGINVIDLLIGICLKIENPSNNHYQGSVLRVGRALAETKYKAEFEEKIQHMIADEKLDDYNRRIAYYLFYNYIYYSKNDERKAANIKKLEELFQKMPKHMTYKVEFDASSFYPEE